MGRACMQLRADDSNLGGGGRGRGGMIRIITSIVRLVCLFGAADRLRAGLRMCAATLFESSCMERIARTMEHYLYRGSHAVWASI